MRALHDCPAGASIAYAFVTPPEAAYLLQKTDLLGARPSPSYCWRDLNGRRSMSWGGSISATSSLLPTPFPDFMDASWPHLLERITTVIPATDRGKGKGKFVPNHVLVNEYLSGQGIMPHTDGPTYEDVVATLSVGSHTILELIPCPSPDIATFSGATQSPAPSIEAPPATQQTIKILLPSRSLLILSGELYSSYLHSIQPVKFDEMESLKACINWESWWEDGAPGLEDRTVAVSSPINGAEENGLDAIDEEEEEGMEHTTGSTSYGRGARGQHDLETLAHGLTTLSVDLPTTTTLLPVIDSSLTSIDAPTVVEIDIKEFVAKRRMVEFSDGWERSRRVSWTCRRVRKTAGKGFRIG